MNSTTKLLAIAAGFVLSFTVAPASAQFNLNEIDGQGAQTGIPLTVLFEGEPPAESLEELLREMYLIEGQVALANAEFAAVDGMLAEIEDLQAELAEKEEDLAALERLGGQVREVIPEGDDSLELQVFTLKVSIRTRELKITQLTNAKAEAEVALAEIDKKIGRTAAEAVKADVEALIEATIAAAEEDILWDDKNARLVEMAAELDAANPVVEAVVVDCIFHHTANTVCSNPAVAAAMEAYEAEMEAEACAAPVDGDADMTCATDGNGD